MDNNQQNNIEIALPEDVAFGIYSNYALVNKSESEFVVDFVQILPGVQQPSVKSRIILAPLHAKRLAATLNAQIDAYEQQCGIITEPVMTTQQVQQEDVADFTTAAEQYAGSQISKEPQA
jgi:hypothetical protein